jgi:hypothetical protein
MQGGASAATHETIPAEDPPQLQGIKIPETIGGPTPAFFLPVTAGQTAKKQEQEPPVPLLQCMLIPEPTKPSANNKEAISNENLAVITQAVATQEPTTQETRQEATLDTRACTLNFDVEVPLKDITVARYGNPAPQYSFPSKVCRRMENE